MSEELPEWEMSNLEYLTAMYYAMSIAGEANAMTKADQERVARINRKCLRITEQVVNDIYSQFFDDEGDNE